MSLKNINPTKTNAWKELATHFEEIKESTIKDFFIDENRTTDFSVQLNDLKLDYSKNRVTKKTMNLLLMHAMSVI